jgi:hypothetical protein
MHHVTEIEAFQVADGGVKAVLRLSQRELLRGENTRWLDDLIPKGRFEHLLIVLGPGGIPVGGGGSYGHGSGGFWAFGSTPPDDQRARPVNGPIHLRFHVVRSFPKAQRFDVRLDCSGAREGARCSAFRNDWVRLLPPVTEGVACSPPAGIDSLEVQGTVDGIPVDRLYAAATAGRLFAGSGSSGFLLGALDEISAVSPDALTRPGDEHIRPNAPTQR